MTTPRPRDLTAAEAAERLGVIRRRVYHFIHTGRLPARALGGIWLIDPADLEKFAAKPRPVGQAGGERHGGAKLTAAQVANIRQAHAGGATISGLARQHGVDRTTIWRIVHNKQWVADATGRKGTAKSAR